MKKQHEKVLTGLHGGRAGGSMSDTVIIDDPYKEGEGPSREEVNKLFNETFSPRLKGNVSTPIVRTHSDSLHSKITNKNDWPVDTNIYGDRRWMDITSKYKPRPSPISLCIIGILSGYIGMILGYIFMQWIGG